MPLATYTVLAPTGYSGPLYSNFVDAPAGPETPPLSNNLLIPRRVMPVHPNSYTSRVSITRPSNTTAYGAGDVIGVFDSGTPANPGSAIHAFTGFSSKDTEVFITDTMLEIDKSSIPAGMTSFRLYLYDASPDAILDNAVWDLTSAGDRAKFLGFIDLGTPLDLGGTLFVQQSGVNKKVRVTAGNVVYGQLVTNGAWTPASGDVFVVTLGTLGAN